MSLGGEHNMRIGPVVRQRGLGVSIREAQLPEACKGQQADLSSKLGRGIGWDRLGQAAQPDPSETPLSC